VASRVTDRVDLQELGEVDPTLVVSLHNDGDRKCATMVVSSKRVEPMRAEVSREELLPADVVGFLEEVSQSALRIRSWVCVLRVVGARDAEGVPAGFTIRPKEPQMLDGRYQGMLEPFTGR